MEFLVEFGINVPDGTPESEVRDREDAEATAAAELAREGHLVRVWKLTTAAGEAKVLGLYDATAERISTSCSALCRSTSGCV
jgi:muconolactone delta-isomerase